jgi:hypothetical protein
MGTDAMAVVDPKLMIGEKAADMTRAEVRAN